MRRQSKVSDCGLGQGKRESGKKENEWEKPITKTVCCTDS